MGGEPPLLTVIVPARNEEARIRECLRSLVGQDARLRVMVSDNSSDDDTVKVARPFADSLDLLLRTIELLGPSTHFVSAGRWGLSFGDSDLFALLAGDDTWSPGFVRAALDELDRHPEADVLYPSFVWADGKRERLLAPVSFGQRWPGYRKLRALLLPNHRELANLVYGVYRRSAFERLLAAWEHGGDEFASDYAAVWTVIGHHRVVACEAAVARRDVRTGVDLLERIGLRRDSGNGIIAKAKFFAQVNVRINRSIGVALARVDGVGWRPSPWQLQVLRGPQWWWRAWRNLWAMSGLPRSSDERDLIHPQRARDREK